MINKRWITLPVVCSRRFTSKAVFWAILKEFEFAVDCKEQSTERPESRDISGNFKRTPSAKFETMISEPRPKQRNTGQNCTELLTFYTFSP